MKFITKIIYFFYTVVCPTLTIESLIHLPHGSILGTHSVTSENKSYYAFVKIPYAEPPVGHLRFQAPRPPQIWRGTLNCTHLDIACHQLTYSNFEQSEDCLYLNVFTPHLPTNDKNVSFPVMFYIHGGGFNDGHSKPYKPDLFINNEVILVTINYRLGPFGFLSTQDHIIPGNNGLKDQHLALQWVYNHISFFGGNPQKITIFGHSAGSASVGYHLLNLKSKGLFWAAICQSGSVLGPWAYQRHPRKEAFKLASFLNNTFSTNNNSTEDLLIFLQRSDAKDLVKAARLFDKSIFGNVSEDFASLEGRSWAPTLETESEEAFVTEKMYELFKSGRFVKVPLLIGFVTEENLNFHFDVDETKKMMKAYDDDLTNLVPVDMEVTELEARLKIGHFIRNMYTRDAAFEDHLGDGVRLCSDNDMTRPIMKQAELYSKLSKTYFYVFSYNGIEMGFAYQEYHGAGNVGHGAELDYLFCLASNCNSSSYPASDQITRNRLIKIWTNFAKFGNPTHELSSILQNISWPILSVDQETFVYVDIGENLKVKNYPKRETYLKWNQLYDSLNRSDFDTY